MQSGPPGSGGIPPPGASPGAGGTPAPKRRRRWLVAAALLVAVAAAGWLLRGSLWIAANRAILESGQRVADLQVERVLQTLEVGPGDRIADVGTGTGVFARPMARAVGEAGKVYAVDVDDRLLEHVAASAREEGLSSLETVRAQPDDPLLPGPVDLVFFCNTLHHIDDRPGYLRRLRRYLVAGGRVAVIDFLPGESPHPTAARRLALPELEASMEAAGYVPAGRHDYLRENFFVVWSCPDCPG